MDNKEIRRANMLMLAAMFGGLQALADKTGTDAKYLSQVKNRWKGRGMGDDVARRIEKALKKTKGWMDVLQVKEAAVETTSATNIDSPEVTRLIKAFAWLMVEEQKDLLADIEAKAATNRAIAKQLGPRFTIASDKTMLDLLKRGGDFPPGSKAKAKRSTGKSKREPGTAMDDFLE